MTDECKELVIGGIKQSLYAKGISDEKPLLLLLHGGPGFPLTPFSHQLSRLEEEFIVVYWDQRGAGKSYDDNIPVETMRIEKFEEDCYEVIQYLKTEYHKKQIFLAGHSWGSVIGINIAHKYPSDIYAYVGISQVVDYVKGNKISYNFALKTLQEKNKADKVERLIEMGEPPYKNDVEGLSFLSGCVYESGGSYHTPVDIEGIIKSYNECASTDIELLNKGMQFSAIHLIKEIVKIDLIKEEKVKFEIPMIFLCGKHDYLVPSDITIDYFETINAPSKEILWFDESAHFLHLEETDKFINTLFQLKKRYY